MVVKNSLLQIHQILNFFSMDVFYEAPEKKFKRLRS